MDSLLADLRYAARQMRRAPAFAAVTILTLALGIGANTAIYSILDAVLLRALPYPEPDRLVVVWEDMSFAGFPRNTPAPGNYIEWRERNRVFADIAATRGATASLTVDGPPEQVLGRRVTASFFTVLGVQPAIGRAFTAEEDEAGAAVAVIGYGLWQRRYSGSATAVGSPIVMNGVTRTVIGVMPRGFTFRNREVEFWTPMQFTAAEKQLRTSHFLNVVARLAPGVSLDAARQDMARVARELAAEFPASNERVGSAIVAIRDDVLGDAEVELLALMGAAGCVLLIACANLASLLLSRAVARRGEMSVRAALGAMRSRLVRQLVVEASLLALAGGLLGALLAPAAIGAIEGLVPTSLPGIETSAVNVRLLLFAAALSLATGVAFSIVPAMHAARASLQDALQGARADVGGRHARTRDALVVAQVAAALVLLVGAALMLRTLANLRSLDLGFDAEHLVTMRTTISPAKYATREARVGFFERVLAGVRAFPGVQDAAYVSTLPFASQGNTAGYTIEGLPPRPDDPRDALFRSGSPDYLRTIGARVIEGRLPDDRDTGTDNPIVVVNQTFAAQYWPGQSALGRRVRFGANDPWRTIVGVVADIRERGYELAMKPGAYVVFYQTGTTFVPETLVVRSTVDGGTLAAGVRRVVAAVDPDQPVAAVRAMTDVIDLSVVDRRQQTMLLATFAGLALLLAAIGLYGVLSYAVTRRRREIGLRMALGASRGSVLRMIVGHGLALTAVGLVLGLALAWAASRAVATLLYGVVATDAPTFAAVLVLLAIVAACACTLPAWRAARVDPMTVLRDE